MRNTEIVIFKRVSFVEILTFTKHLAVMVKSGISLGTALDTLTQQTDNRYFSSIVSQILQDIENGQTLAHALAKFPKQFDSFYINMVTVGEESGKLEENLFFLAEHLEKQYALKQKIQGALLYPSFVLVAAGILSMFIGLFVLPQLVTFFEGFQVELPLPTRILLSVAQFMQNYGILFFSAVGAVIFGTTVLVKTAVVRPHWHRVILKLPLFGKLLQYAQITAFARNCSVLLGSGISITRALEATEKTLSNTVYKTIVADLNSNLKKGKKLSSALSQEKHSQIPLLVSRMIAVGEETGNLEETLSYLAEFYESEIDTATKQLTTVLEPLLLLCIGVVVGFIALAIISPIYELTGSVQR